MPPGAKGSPAVIPVALGELAAFSSLRIYIPQDLRTQASCRLHTHTHTQKRITECACPHSVPLIAPLPARL